MLPRPCPAEKFHLQRCRSAAKKEMAQDMVWRGVALGCEMAQDFVSLYVCGSLKYNVVLV